MDKKVKNRWLKQLRSGKWKQATGALVNDQGGFCCLGVLCANEKLPRAKSSKKIFLNPSKKGEEYTGHIPVSFRRSVGITSVQENKLIELNDGDHLSFLEIADWIEKNL